MNRHHLELWLPRFLRYKFLNKSSLSATQLSLSKSEYISKFYSQPFRTSHSSLLTIFTVWNFTTFNLLTNGFRSKQCHCVFFYHNIGYIHFLERISQNVPDTNNSNSLNCCLSGVLLFPRDRVRNILDIGIKVWKSTVKFTGHFIWQLTFSFCFYFRRAPILLFNLFMRMVKLMV